MAKKKETKKAGKTEEKEKEGLDEKELESEVEAIEEATGENEKPEKIQIKASKPISQIKKGDKVKVDGVEYEVDTHYVLIDHKTTKEMAIEIFNPKTDKDYQIRYFNDNAENTMEFYELEGEIMFVRKPAKKIEW